MNIYSISDERVIALVKLGQSIADGIQVKYVLVKY